MKKKLSGILGVFLALTMCICAGASQTFAAGNEPEPSAGKQVEVTVTHFSIQNLSGKDVDRMYWTDKFYLAMKWDASSHGANLHQGDYFDMTLPDKMKFPSDTSARDFNIYGEDGTTVIATAHVTPGPNDTGGTVRVTFTDWVEGKENVRGSIRLGAIFDTQQVTRDSRNNFQLTVNGKVIPIDVDVFGPKKIEDEVLAKWARPVPHATEQPQRSSNPSAGELPSANNPDQAEWHVRINHKKATLTDVVISDRLSEGTGRETYISDSFRLSRVKMNEYGNVTEVLEEIDLTNRLTLSADKKSFTLKLGSVNADQYTLYYRTTYTPGTTLRNSVQLISQEESKTTSATSQSAQSGGNGEGSLANKIKLIKVDAEDGTRVLAGAVFEVTRPDGTTFELTTGADGTVTSGALTSGTYTVKEKTAPMGYELNDTVYTLTVNSQRGAIQTITDKPMKISVSVTKKWVGTQGGSVKIRLLADGVDTGSAITLEESNGWKGSFDNLRRFTADGKEITYTVAEDAVDGYSSEIAGDATNGFTVTNTKIPVPETPVPQTPSGKAGLAKTGSSNVLFPVIALTAVALMAFYGASQIRRSESAANEDTQ